MREQFAAIRIGLCVMTWVSASLLLTPGARAQQSKSLAGQQAQLDEALRLNDQAVGLYQQGKARDAVSTARKAVDIRKRILGEMHPFTARSLDNLGHFQTATGEYAAARLSLEQTLRIFKNAHGEEHADTARTTHNLGMLFVAQGDYATARPYLERALQIRKKVLGMEHSDTAISLGSLGLLLRKIQDYAAARPYFEQALQIHKKVDGEQHFNTAASLNNLGVLLMDQGRYAASRSYLEQALKIWKTVLGDEHPDTAVAANNLGLLCKHMGDFAAARSYYEQALRINKTIHGEEHVATALSLNNLGCLLGEMRDFDAARSYHEQALKIRRKVLGSQHPDTAQSLHNLAAAIRDFTVRKSYLEQALEISKKVFGEDHPSNATSLNDLGWIHHSIGNDLAARPYYERALQINKNALGKDHPNTSVSFHNLARLDAAQQEWAAAGQNVDLGRRGVRQHIARVLPSLSEKEQLTFLQHTVEDDFHTALSLGVRQAQDRELASLSASWLLNGKGVAHAAIAERTLLSRQTRNPRVASVARKLQTIRQQLAQISMSLPEPNQIAARQQRVTELAVEDDQLTRQLAELTGRPVQTKEWVELGSVRQSLPPHSCLIEFARFKPMNFNAKGEDKLWQPARYAAWIIPPAGSGRVNIVDLGEAEPIEQLIEKVREKIEQTGVQRTTLRQKGEPGAVEELSILQAALSERIVTPLQEHMANADTLILSPDANLWLVPWGALSVKAEGPFLIEDFDLRYVLSGRELVESVTDNGNPNQPVIFANPQFDSGPDQVLQSLKAIFRDKWMKDENFSHSLSFSNNRLLPRVLALPGTASEAKAILPQLAKFAKEEPQSYLGPYALESVFKAVHRPRVAVLSTHGFFLSDQETKPTDQLTENTRSVALTVDGKPLENPLLRCGLLFAGCNDPKAGEGSGDDGVLTGMEIVGIDLEGTELVVLSACETGVGTIRNGEGVAGLRQAFQLAGAEAVVATLWQVPDAESAELMGDFFAFLNDGSSKSQALRKAQLKQIAKRRELYSTAHPYYWAAFTITGR